MAIELTTPQTSGDLKALETANFSDDVDGSNIQLKGLQAVSTLNTDFQKDNPRIAALNKYRHKGQLQNDLGFKVGDKINEFMHRDSILGRIADKGPLAGGLAGVGVGALAGGAAGWLHNQFSDKKDKNRTRNYAAIAALLGGLTGSYSGHWRQKTAGWRQPGGMGPSFVDTSSIDRAISACPELSFHQKSSLISGVNMLPPQLKQQLSGMLGSAFGASVGVLVAKFLMKAGLGGTVVSAVVGGMLGNAVFGRKPSRAGKDIFGHQLPY